jgi:hypothetical protein
MPAVHIGADFSRVKRDFDPAAGRAQERLFSHAAGRHLGIERVAAREQRGRLRTVLPGAQSMKGAN